jgi:hypothetical protein
MGCDIHIYAEKVVGLEWEHIPGLEPFNNCNYGTFGFLANVRNYSDVIPISNPRGIPSDVSNLVKLEYEEWGIDAHSASWLTVDELLLFDYDKDMEDRRITVKTGPHSWNGGATAKPGYGKKTTFREFLDEWFFKNLQELKDSGAGRIVFWFDN